MSTYFAWSLDEIDALHSHFSSSVKMYRSIDIVINDDDHYHLLYKTICVFGHVAKLMLSIIVSLCSSRSVN